MTDHGIIQGEKPKIYKVVVEKTITYKQVVKVTMYSEDSHLEDQAIAIAKSIDGDSIETHRSYRVDSTFDITDDQPPEEIQL